MALNKKDNKINNTEKTKSQKSKIGSTKKVPNRKRGLLIAGAMFG